MTKSLNYTPQGELKKNADQCWMAAGTAATKTMTLEELPEYLPTLKLNQAIVHGVCGHENAKIVSAAKFKDQPGTITRSKENFRYPNPALAMIDYDADEGQPERSHEDVIAIIDSVCPGFVDTPKVLTYSTSSCIYDKEDNEIRGRGSGLHLYFLVKNGKDIPRFAETLFQRLWLARYGYIKISRSGALLPRTIFDAAVFSPERLDFVAGANLMTSNIVQRRPAPLYIPGRVK